MVKLEHKVQGPYRTLVCVNQADQCANCILHNDSDKALSASPCRLVHHLMSVRSLTACIHTQVRNVPSQTGLGAPNYRHEALRLVYGLGWLRPATLGCDDQEADLELESGGTNGKSKSSSINGKRRREPPSADMVTHSRGVVSARKNSISQLAAGKAPSVASSPACSIPPTTGAGEPTYLSCPFEKVLRLVRSRQVILRGGKALLTPGQVPMAVVEHFVDGLRKGLEIAERGLPGVEADERVRRALVKVRR